MKRKLSALIINEGSKEKLRMISEIEKRSMSQQINTLIDEAWDRKYSYLYPVFERRIKGGDIS